MTYLKSRKFQVKSSHEVEKPQLLSRSLQSQVAKMYPGDSQVYSVHNRQVQGCKIIVRCFFALLQFCK